MRAFGKWFLILVGMATLVFGLGVQLKEIFRAENPDMFLPSVLYLVGAGILVFPPLIELGEAQFEAERRFARLLITLEIFLVLSGSLSFWHNVELKVPVRILASLLVTGFLKYGLGELRDFDWGVFYNPIKFFRYHYECLTGKLSDPAYSMALGIDWLGIGYAFIGYQFGQLALTIGSGYLFLSSLRGYLAGRKPISVAWTLLNALYVIASGAILIATLV